MGDDEITIGPDGVTSGSEESAAPHLPAEEVWTPVSADSPVRDLTAEEKWPGEWHAIAWMVAHGSAQRSIARELDYTEGRISVILSKPAVQEKIEQIRREFGSASLAKRFEQTAPKAMDFLAAVITGKEQAKTSERLDASKWLLEKQTGKPKQEVALDGGTTILQLLHALDAAKEAKQTEGEARGVLEITANKAEPAPKDALVDWVSENVTEVTGEKS